MTAGEGAPSLHRAKVARAFPVFLLLLASCTTWFGASVPQRDGALALGFYRMATSRSMGRRPEVESRRGMSS